MNGPREVDENVVQEVVASASMPVAGETFKGSETTRLLSASAYLDREFRDLVIKHCVENRHKALGAGFGMDMPTVVRHCRRAKRIMERRELWLLVPGIAGLIFLGSVMNATPEQILAPSRLVQTIVVSAVILLTAFGICYYYSSQARSIILKNFRRGAFVPDAGLSSDSMAVEPLQAAESGNTVIYSGFTPFVGSGENMEAWSFALDLRKRACDPSDPSGGRENLSADEIEQISLESLYTCVESEIAKLNLRSIRVQDKLYINGRDIRDDKRFLMDPLGRPQYSAPRHVVRNAMLEQGEKHLRHYRCVRVVDWQGELVLSIFLRFSKLSHNLFVEASYYLLTPVGERFRKVDMMSPYFKFGRFFKDLAITAIKTPFLTLLAPFAVLGRLIGAINHWSLRRKEDQMIRDNPSYDYGAAFSFRQWASPNEYRRYFQKLDKEMYMKVLEKNIFDSIFAFLEEHNIDVSELRQRQMTILNNGVMVSNGNVNATNVATGPGAKVEQVTHTVAQRVAQLTSKVAAPVGQPG